MRYLIPAFCFGLFSTAALANSAGPYKNSRSGGQAGKYCQRAAGFNQAQYMAGQTTLAQRRKWEACMMEQGK